MRLWIGLCLAVPLIFAQSTGPNAAAKKIRLEGRVLSTNGEPVRKASLRLQGTAIQSGERSADYTESSDNDGKFLFDDVPPGRYTLTAEKSGFVTGRYGARTPTSPAAQLSVGAGQQMTNLVILLTPHGVISGKVLDQDGDPLERAQIEVMRLGYKRGRRELLAAGGTSTDDQGNFRVADLTPGRYFLSAQDRKSINFGRDDRPGRSGTGNEGYVITYYPGVVDVSSASSIDVTAGAEQTGIVIQLRRSRVFAIRGRVADTTTTVAMQNLQVMALPKEMSGAAVNMLISRSLQQVRPDGSFEIRNLSPGAYVLQNLTSFSSGDGVATRVTGRLEVTIADSDVDARLVLGAGAEINGTVRLERSGISSAVANVPGLRPRIELIPADVITLGTPNAQIRDDGTFQIKGVPASRFVVNVGSVPESMYVKAIRFANVDVTKEVLDLTSGTSGALDVVLGANASDVSGVLRDSKGEAMGGVSLTLWPKDLVATSPWTQIRSTATDQSGNFKFAGLGPGSYYVAAWDDVEAGLLQNAAFLTRFTNDAVAVKLEEGSHETADLKLITRDKIEVEVAKLQ